MSQNRVGKHMQLDLVIDYIRRSVKGTGIFCLPRILPKALRRVHGVEPENSDRVFLMRSAEIWTGIKLYLSMILLAGICSAQPYSLRLGPTQYAYVNPPAAWTLGNYRTEIGITKRSGTFGASDAGQQIFYDAGPGYWRCQTDAGGTGVTVWCRDVHDNANVLSMDITGMSDVRFRFQRSVNGVIGTSTLSAGLWDGQGNLVGEYTQTPAAPETAYSWGQPIVIGQAGLTFDIRFVRFGSTLLPLGSKAPVEVPATPSEFVEYDFENSLADASGNSALALQLNNPAGTTCIAPCSYQTSPSYNPIASIGGTQYGVAGNQTITLTSASFSSANLNGLPASFAYSVTAKPTGGDGTLGTPTAANTTMVLNDVLGTYSVQLTVTDSHGSGSATTKIGAVPENADHTVKYYRTPLTQTGQEAAFKLGTGPLLRYGTSAHSSYEKTWLAYANDPGFGTTNWAPTAEIGNIGCTGHIGRPGGGWTFVQDTNSPVPCNFNTYVSATNDPYNLFWVHFPLPDSSMNGRFVANIASGIGSVTATQIIASGDLTAGQAALFPCTNPGPCYQWGGVGNTKNPGGFTGWIDSNSNWNYYENALAFYRLWLMTGIDDFLTRARAVEDEHWLHTMANGYALPGCFGELRCDSIVSASLRALDGKPWMWAGIDYHLTSTDWGPNGRSGAMTATTPYPANYGFGEPRDSAYDLRFVSMLAGSIQNADGTPNTARRAQYCTGVRQGVENIFKPTITSTGLWVGNFISGSYTAAWVGLGTEPFENGLISSGALEMAADVMTTACTGISDRAAVASDALALIKSSVDLLFSALDTNMGAFGKINYTDGPPYTGNGSIIPEGRVTFTTGSTAVVGTGLAMTSGDGRWAAFGGTYTATVRHTYTVVIDGTGSPDTFKWQLDSGSFTTGVAITGAAQNLSNGITVTFASTTGHAVNDTWVGKSSAFKDHFLSDASTMVSMDSGMAGIGSVALRVATVTDDAHMTLTAPYPNPTPSGTTVTGPISSAHSFTEANGTGTVSLSSANGAVVTGTGTAFLSQFLPDCTTFISPYLDRRLYLIRSIADNTHMTLSGDQNCTSDYSWPNASLTNVAYHRTAQGLSGTNCPSAITMCEGFTGGGGWLPSYGPMGDLGLNFEQIAGMGYYFLKSGTGSYKTNGDAWFTATFGGMGDPSAPYFGQLGKTFGQVYGAGNSPNYLAWSVVAGPCSTLSFSPSSASPAIGGGTGTFNATVTDSTCDRSVTSSAGWLTCTANCTGTGSVTGIGWSAAANASTARSATLTGGGVSFTVNQAGTTGGTGTPSTVISGGHAVTGGVTIR
jgi:hypothetical protein